MIVRVLERWLRSATARLESGASREPNQAADPRQPPPPDHWVELVRQHAPQLLDSESLDASDSALVIDWRSDDLESESPVFTSPTARPRPLRLHPSQHRHTPPVATRTTAPAPKNHPLRLERVTAEALEAEDISPHPADASAAPLPPEGVRTTTRPVATTVPVHAVHSSPPTAAPAAESHFNAQSTEPVAASVVSTSAPVAAPVRQRRLGGLRLPSLRLPIWQRQHDAPGLRDAPRGSADLRPEELPPRAVPTTPTHAERPPSHFSDLPFERQHIRETRSSVPSGAQPPRLSGVRTGAGGNVHPHQQRTAIPGAPPQLVLRPTHAHPALNIDDITADRWASLPDPPPEDSHDTASPRYERLKREQEGRAWSE